MRLIFFSLIFSICSAFTCNGQFKNDSITTVKKFGNYQYYYRGDLKVDLNEMLVITRNNKRAHSEMNQAKKLYHTSIIFAMIGGNAIGLSLVLIPTQIGFNEGIFGLGAAALLVSVPITLKMYEHMDRGMELHNAGLSKPLSLTKTNLNFGLTDSGIGFVFRF